MKISTSYKLVPVGENITFKDEMGIPAVTTGNGLAVRGGSDGSEVALYAYETLGDSTEKIAGKLNILSFDEEINKVYLVPVNGASVPDDKNLKTALDGVYQQAVAKWQVDIVGTGEAEVMFLGKYTTDPVTLIKGIDPITDFCIISK